MVRNERLNKSLQAIRRWDNMYVVYNFDNEPLNEFKTVKEAKQFIKECKRFDKEQGNPFDEQYRIEKEED